MPCTVAQTKDTEVILDGCVQAACTKVEGLYHVAGSSWISRARGCSPDPCIALSASPGLTMEEADALDALDANVVISAAVQK